MVPPNAAQTRDQSQTPFDARAKRRALDGRLSLPYPSEVALGIREEDQVGGGQDEPEDTTRQHDVADNITGCAGVEIRGGQGADEKQPAWEPGRGFDDQGAREAEYGEDDHLD